MSACVNVSMGADHSVLQHHPNLFMKNGCSYQILCLESVLDMVYRNDSLTAHSYMYCVGVTIEQLPGDESLTQQLYMKDIQ